jgi:hypothetical protein
VQRGRDGLSALPAQADASKIAPELVPALQAFAAFNLNVPGFCATRHQSLVVVHEKPTAPCR